MHTSAEKRSISIIIRVSRCEIKSITIKQAVVTVKAFFYHWFQLIIQKPGWKIEQIPLLLIEQLSITQVNYCCSQRDSNQIEARLINLYFLPS